jgi:signal peptidase I
MRIPRGTTVLLRLTDALLTAILLATLALAGLVIAAPLTGHQPFILRGGSMSPAIPRGAIAIIAKPPLDTLQPGDVVTFQVPNGAVITHRITAVSHVAGATWLETKGDANDTPDPDLIPVTWVIGRVVLSIPLAGYLLALPSSLLGIVALASLVLCLMGAHAVLVSAQATKVGRPLVPDALRQ